MASPPSAFSNTTTTATDPDVEATRMMWALVWFLAVLPALWLMPPVFSCCRRWRRLCFRGDATELSPATDASAQANATGAQLEAAERASKRLHLRVNGTLWQVGWMLATSFFVPIFYTVIIRRGAPTAMDASPIVGSYILWSSVFVWGLSMMMLSVRPTESTRIRGVIFSTSIVTLLGGLFCLTALYDHYRAGRRGQAFVGLSVGTASMAWLFTSVHSLCGHRCFRSEPLPPRRQLQRQWLAFYAFDLVWGTSMVCAGTFRWTCSGSYCTAPPRDCLIAGISAFVCLLVSAPANRGRIIRRLGSLGKRGPAEQQAASVAVLLGDTSVAKALTDAIKCFRAQPVSTLTCAALSTNEPDPSLQALTVPATLGAVDAFISHSWNDNGSLKYDKVLEWAQEPSGNGNKLVWLDKSCIDQRNIDASLLCLPIFLSGCQQLLMLVGPTYMTRLWCVMEVFIFMRIKNVGGTADVAKLARQVITIKLLESKADLAQHLLRFNAAKAKCRYDRDRQKLLAVIEASFGTMAPFNQLVLQVLNTQIIGLKDSRRRGLVNGQSASFKVDLNVQQHPPPRPPQGFVSHEERAPSTPIVSHADLESEPELHA